MSQKSQKCIITCIKDLISPHFSGGPAKIWGGESQERQIVFSQHGTPSGDQPRPDKISLILTISLKKTFTFTQCVLPFLGPWWKSEAEVAPEWKCKKGRKYKTVGRRWRGGRKRWDPRQRRLFDNYNYDYYYIIMIIIIYNKKVGSTSKASI